MIPFVGSIQDSSSPKDSIAELGERRWESRLRRRRLYMLRRKAL